MRVCIAGGGGAASNAANVVRRLDKEAQIDIFTDRADIGNQPCEIPFVLNRFLASWDDTFVFRPKFYSERSINVHFNAEVTEIIRPQKRLVAGGETYTYDRLILDLGAVPAIPPIPGIDGESEFVLATNLRVARAFEEAIPNHSTAAIIGVGQIALEVASVLRQRGYEKIYLLGRSDRVLRAYLDKDMAERVEARVRDSDIDLILAAKIESIASRNGKKLVSLPDMRLEVGLVFFAVGSRPNVELARKAGLEIGETGGIAVDPYFRTSDPDIYAIGDCTEVWDAILGRRRLSQTATSAARAGRIAATNLVLGDMLPYQGTTMAFVMDAFGYQIGTVGYTESYAREQELDVLVDTMTTATRRPSFGGKRIHVKLVVDRKSEALVGAQIISEERVAGKIDRLAVAISEKIPVRRLALMDTCYHPTVGTAYEPVIMALDELRLKLDNRKGH